MSKAKDLIDYTVDPEGVAGEVINQLLDNASTVVNGKNKKAKFDKKTGAVSGLENAVEIAETNGVYYALGTADVKAYYFNEKLFDANFTVASSVAAGVFNNYGQAVDSMTFARGAATTKIYAYGKDVTLLDTTAGDIYAAGFNKYNKKNADAKIEEVAYDNKIIEVDIEEFIFQKSKMEEMEMEENESEKSRGMNSRGNSKTNEYNHTTQRFDDQDVTKPKSNSKYGNTKSTYDYYSSYDRKEKGERIGVCGLQNLGNTCFMNSALQCFLHTIPLIKQFEDPNWRQQINYESALGNKGKLVNAWFDLVKEYWSGYKSIAPRAFKSAIAEIAPQFTGYQQHDSQELMSYLLDGIHE